ncbi:hypothetical protein KC363_g4982 [Hortaea werneckii]|uniref:Carbohydrate kinase PfkB domain-containing protein n=1 Tax=Hortaea werneckii TaxID=91943 RepID=A0A3M7FHZ6_HORWE|nr:hypothetical protein KC363_g4982 [Hortaea werneckii]RMY88101.1 hypothetical protein D0861_04994 [Hortaea werneckii]
MPESDCPRMIALGNGVWLDEIRNEGAAPIRDVPGGSVTFSTLGARLFIPKDPECVSMVFNAGGDFPSAVIDIFKSWSITLTINYQSDKPSSRGLVFYEKANGNRKGFQRLTEPLPVEVTALQGTKMLSSRAFTFFGTSEYIETQTSHIEKLRPTSERTTGNPLIIWEPHAKSCRPDTLKSHLAACHRVDVFSPNHEELASFFEESMNPDFDRALIESQAREFVESGIGLEGTGCIVVRAAEHGCLMLSKQHGAVWIPSYYSSTSHMVVDPTGAGNAFLGAFAIGFQETGSYIEAAKYGQVAASFVIEQVGLPTKFGHGDREIWNNCNARERLAEYQARSLESYIPTI